MDPPVREREGAVVFFLVRHGAWRYGARKSRSGRGSAVSSICCQNGVDDGAGCVVACREGRTWRWLKWRPQNREAEKGGGQKRRSRLSSEYPRLVRLRR